MSTHGAGAGPTVTGRSRRNRQVVVLLLVAAAVIAGVLSFYASSSPDGLNRVAEDHQFISLEQSHDAEDSPLAGYATRGIDGSRLSGGLAGVVGVGLTFLIGGGIFLAVRRRSEP